MKIIDFHTHIYPQEIAFKATHNTCEFYGLHTDLTGTGEMLLEKGKKAGISQFVLLPVATKAEQVQSINNFTAAETNLHEEFCGFGTIHAQMHNPEAEIERIKSLGLKGLKLHPDFQKFAIDDERLFPVYDLLQDDMPIVIHCGDRQYDYSNPRRLRNVLDKFPRLIAVAAHLGGWTMFNTAFEYLKDTRCYVDISSCIEVLPPELLTKYICRYSADRVLFGTDFPLWEPEKEVEMFLNLDISDSDKEKIASLNADYLLR